MPFYVSVYDHVNDGVKQWNAQVYSSTLEWDRAENILSFKA